MSPDQYRQDYGLPNTYPMVAPDYAERRRELAKAIGLGSRGRGGRGGAASGEAPKAQPKRRARKATPAS
jgi:predicted transcriptional regulator